MINHKDMKKIIKQLGFISNCDYVRSVGPKWTDLWMNTISKKLTDNSKYIITYNDPTSNDDAVTLISPNLKDIYREIQERFASKENPIGFDRSKNRIIGHFEDTNRLRIGNKNSNHFYIDFEIANLQNLIRKNSYSYKMTHHDFQGELITLGLSLGFDVKVASNDINGIFKGGKLQDLCTLVFEDLDLSHILYPIIEKNIDLIDVLWVFKNTGRVFAAFEVELNEKFRESMAKFNELNNHSLYYNHPIYYVILGKDDKFSNARDQSYLSRFNNAFTKGILKYITISSFKDCLALRDNYKNFISPNDFINIFLNKHMFDISRN